MPDISERKDASDRRNARIFLYARIRELHAQACEVLRSEGLIVSEEAWAQLRSIDAEISRLWGRIRELEAVPRKAPAAIGSLAR